MASPPCTIITTADGEFRVNKQSVLTVPNLVVSCSEQRCRFQWTAAHSNGHGNEKVVQLQLTATAAAAHINKLPDSYSIHSSYDRDVMCMSVHDSAEIRTIAAAMHVCRGPFGSAGTRFAAITMRFNCGAKNSRHRRRSGARFRFPVLAAERSASKKTNLLLSDFGQKL